MNGSAIEDDSIISFPIWREKGMKELRKKLRGISERF